MLNKWQLLQRQGLPLNAKIEMSKLRIREWYEHWEGLVYISFSGGKDSTVLRHLVNSVYPNTPSVFVNTGLEFPENVRLVKETEDVITIKPTRSFKQVIQRFGFPVISKETARKLYDLQNPTKKNKRTRDVRMGLTNSKVGHCPRKWLFLKDAPFKISDRCCDALKKQPIKRYENKSGQKAFIGNIADEGRYRLMSYLRTGCNAFDLARPYSTPIAFWTEGDIWGYLKKFNIPISSIYAKGYSRTGCMFCMFGVHLESSPNRFQRMKQTHPKIWEYCMDKLGCRQVLEYIGVEYA